MLVEAGVRHHRGRACPTATRVMDGPVIQHAAAQALAGGVRVDDVFRATAAVARRRRRRRSS